MAAVASARSQLRAAGYNGPVVTVDTLTATRSNPILCNESDFCAVNCHAYFDSQTSAKNAGNFVTTQVATLKAVLANPSQEIVITESGWPSQGDPNGAAIASAANQASAISALMTAFSSDPADLFLFNAFNTYWKTSGAGQFNAEPYWGIHGNDPTN